MTIFSKADFANSDALRTAAERAIAENKLPTPALPHAVQKLIELTRRPMASFDEAVTVLAGAPLLAGRIARRVRMGIVGQGTSPGTPAGDPPKPITGPSKRPDARELKQIALRLGLIGLRDLAYELSAGALIFHAPGARDSMRVLRRHSLVVAHLSRIICKHISIDVDEPFMAGLLHDAGWGLMLREICRSDEPPSNLIPLISAMDAVHIAATRRLAKEAEGGQSVSAAATLARRAGATSRSNHGLRCIQPPLRQEGWGSGKYRGPKRVKSRTVSVRVCRFGRCR